MSAPTIDCVQSGGRLSIALRLPAGSAAATLAGGITVTDAFGRPLGDIQVAAPALDEPETVRISANAPACGPDADPPACILTLPSPDGVERIAFAPARPAVRPGTPAPAPAPPPGGIAIDYTARDYDALRTMMKARISRLVGGDAAATLAHPADPLATLVEVLAYAGDQIAFRQDAAGTEAYLPTARNRVSLRRHARPRDYAVDDGRCARTVLAFTVGEDGMIPAGLAAVTRQLGRPAAVLDPGAALSPHTTVFETLEPLAARRSRNDLGPPLVRPAAYVIPEGACEATLAGAWPDLRPGMLLVLRQRRDPAGGTAFGVQALRLLAVEPQAARAGRTASTGLRWHPEDALARPLTVPPAEAEGAVELLGNVVLADHGRTQAAPLPLDPPIVSGTGAYRPRLVLEDPVVSCPLPAFAIEGVPDVPGASLCIASAHALLNPDPREAVACVALREFDDGDPAAPASIWRPVRDRLAAPPTGRVFSIAPERASRTGPCGLVLDFGDGTFGRRPSGGTRFGAVVRTGGGLSGQVDADTLVQVIGEAPLVEAVTNPLAASPEPPETDAAIRLLAATGYRAQERGITAEDWERLLARDPLVAAVKAEAVGGFAPCAIGLALRTQDAFALELLEARIRDLAVLGAEPALAVIADAFLDAAFVAYCRPGSDIGAARLRLAAAFGPGRRPDGTPAFLDPVLWPPGRDADPTAFADEIARDPAVTQVVTDPAADPRVRFGLVGEAGAPGPIVLGPQRRLCARNDPLRPETGRLVLYLAGSP